ncbi:WD40-repeat-containing domain protein [Radiomyces spectabilis]|uniref:WD40-repeat-containing domain protein n=1 Tax=Radiomyces spectabilis TaxID=64574 RepID=UPI00221E64AF|nr:WD40-repeat-containing domain protein [Radiomyces spectabilis]KAI8372736.1 WD40-repeat-containing domain protein [Radiomyces spectabilis]
MTVIESACVSRDPVQYVRVKPRIHDQKVSIHHWQLRDLVLTRQEPYATGLIVPTGQDVFEYNYKTGHREFLMSEIGYPPTCMTTGFGYVAAGGQRGDLTLRNLENENQMTITTSPNCTINNGLCLSQVHGNTRLLVANNDATIRVFTVPYLEHIDTLNFRTAVNHTAVSPDGGKMVAVGDDNNVHLFAITLSGRYDLVATMAASRDANFSVSWNHTSDKFAVASQDGTVHVWDIRNRQPLCKFGGNQNTSITKGAARCVKFTQSGAVDLLAFTEHVSHVNIIDARTFDAMQTIRVGPAAYDTPITGLSFSPDSQSMFVGLEGAILEYKVDTGMRRRFPRGALL